LIQPTSWPAVCSITRTGLCAFFEVCRSMTENFMDELPPGDGELLDIAALDKKAVRIMPIWQQHTPDGYALRPEPTRKRLRGTPAAAVRIGIEGQVDGSLAIA
jgi:hypothetical protein